LLQRRLAARPEPFQQFILQRQYKRWQRVLGL
jgi:hypothetical protein